MVLPFMLLSLLVLAESPTWRGYQARLAPSCEDRSTAEWITVLALAGGSLGLIVGQWARGVPAVGLPMAAPVGVVLACLGAGLRGWAILSLGAQFTLTLQASPDRPLVERGPYRWIRHPGYLGGELAVLGLGLGCGNWLSPFFCLLPMLIAHLWRIPIEERLMERVHGERWRVYRSRTWRLLPLLF